MTISPDVRPSCAPSQHVGPAIPCERVFLGLANPRSPSASRASRPASALVLAGPRHHWGWFRVSTRARVKRHPQSNFTANTRGTEETRAGVTGPAIGSRTRHIWRVERDLGSAGLLTGRGLASGSVSTAVGLTQRSPRGDAGSEPRTWRPSRSTTRDPAPRLTRRSCLLTPAKANPIVDASCPR
jgi:hypothetical protein